jgi:hypothetical protein
MTTTVLLQNIIDAISGPGEASIDSYSSVAIAADADTANQTLVAAPGANKQIWVYGWQGAAGTGNGSIAFQDEDDAALSGAIPVVQNVFIGSYPTGNFSQPLFKVATNKALEIDTATASFAGILQYAVVSV